MRRKALSVSEVNQLLLSKGYKVMRTIRIDIENSWDADIVSFEEYGDGKSYCNLYKFYQHEGCPEGCGNLKRLANYSKLKAAEKHEFINIVNQLPINN